MSTENKPKTRIWHNFRGLHRLLQSSKFTQRKDGVAILIRNATEAKKISIKTKLNAIAVKIKRRKKITIRSLIYIPLLSNNQVRRLIRQFPKPFIITGDLNTHNHRWGGKKENWIGKIITKIINEESLKEPSQKNG
jgi:hypothetical protein